MSERAQTANLLAAASAASTDTLVRMIHPEWEDEQVDEEVAKIEDAETDRAADDSRPRG